GLEKRPENVASLQAVAAVGQSKLMHHYDFAFQAHHLQTAQVLLTADDLADRGRYLNVRNTLLRLLDLGTIPIVNENDTVAIDELVTHFGDNDRLAALVTNLVRAPLLVILSDVEGLYDGNPALPESALIPVIQQIDDQTFKMVCDQQSGLSRGGMMTKLEAAKMVTLAGENAIITSGKQKSMLSRVFNSEPLGTLFLAQGKSLTPRKRWIGFSAQSKGDVALDSGASDAIVRCGRSLLSIGVRRVKGTFGKGDVITLVDSTGKAIARGLTNYTSDELQRIRGLSSREIIEVLGHVPYEEVVHRDNLLVLEPTGD
ncbi:MAG: glutamate 5-kinase, partial [Planctomycetota bacterium]|nr:glutamate 5-kinase [Planctomycetota bacterium]